MHYPDYVYFIIIIAVKNNVNIKEDYMSRKGENIYKRKDGRWEGRYKKGNADNGRTIYGSCYGKTYREVKEKLKIFRMKPLFSTTKTNSVKRFADYCDEWLLVKQSKVKESTFAKYATVLENHIKPYFGSYQAGQITTELTAAFVNHLIYSKKLSSKTANDITVMLKSILKYVAKNTKYIKVSCLYSNINRTKTLANPNT